MIYSATLTVGAIKMQNLESRGWGFAGSILAMLPLNVGALQFVSAMLLRVLLELLFDEASVVTTVLLVWMTIIWLLSLAVGVWNLITLNNEDVIAGFEYNPD
jgi:hypothetical protein